MFHRALLAAACCCVIAIGTVPVTASAQISVASDGKRKINLSGRQRMLSQRIAKAACFAAIGEDKPGHMTMLKDASGLFDRTLKGLQQGDAELGMNSETQPDILAGLESVGQLWGEYGSMVNSALDAGEVSTDALTQIAQINVPTLREMNRTVGLFERKYGASGDIHPALALAINVSGRQRMLSQKASKEFCLIVAGVQADANRENLAQTIELFDGSLTNLIEGNDDEGLPEAPTDELLVQLEEVQGLWLPLKVIFEKAASGGTPDAAEIAKVAAGNNPLLVEMNRAVGMYENL